MNSRLLLPLLLSLFLAQAAAAQIQFAELPGLAFLDSTSYLNGVTWVDVDNDYDLDVSLSGFGGIPPDFINRTAIFRNLGGGVFINDSLVVSSQSTPMRHGWADIDNNGWLDVYYGATWNFGGVNELWLNDNDTLLNQFNGSGATSNMPQPYEGTVSWGDYDNDGFVDLFLARWNDLKNQLFRNNGDSTFTEITTGELVNDLGWTSGGFWGDFNNDGWLDIYVIDYQEDAVTPGVNDLFVNNGDGTFTKLGATAGDIVTTAENTRSANWVDANNDGWLDLFVANQFGQNKLYLNNGDSTFFTLPIGDANQVTWSSNWGDYDNDGDQDLVTLGFFGSESRFWRNDFTPLPGGGGGVTFTDITSTFQNIFPTEISGSNSNGVIWVDYDRDGWLDLHITQPDLVADHFYRNLGDTCITWIEIKLTGGDSSNVAGIGAVIRAKANVDGNDLWQMRQVSAQTASTGSNPLWQHFGFHKAETIDSLVVEWTSGQVCVFTEVDVNQVIEILESCEINVIVPQPKPGNTTTLTFCFPAGDTTLVPQISNGEWSATCDNCISQNGSFDGSNLPPGGYMVTYSQGDGICDSTDTWNISIIDPTGIDESITFCPEQGDQQLFPPSGQPGGTWSASCGNCINAQGVLAVSTLVVGVYQVFYEYQGQCGELTDQITVNITTIIAGDDTEVSFCPGSLAADLFPKIQGNPQAGGQFFNANSQPVIMPFFPTAATTPLFYIVGTGACRDTAEVTVFLRENPTIETSGDTTVFAGQLVTLQASGAQDFTWSPSQNLSCANCANPIFTADTTTVFKVNGTSEFGCKSTDSLTVTVLPAPVFQTPNIFTPNGDNVNETFNPVFQGEIFQQFRLRIFNRWGQLVFETSDPGEGWNGEQDGEPAPSDVYVYVLNFRLINETEGTESGDVTLVR